MVGGGVRGKDGGIDRVTITQVGITIKVFPLFIVRYPDTGETNIGNAIGEDINGTLYQYLTMKFKETGKFGKRISIGRTSKLGASGGYENKRIHDNIRKKEDNSNKRIDENTTSTTGTTGTQDDDSATGKVGAFIVVGLNPITLCRPAIPLFCGAYPNFVTSDNKTP
jgi:hypothetical protein